MKQVFNSTWQIIENIFRMKLDIHFDDFLAQAIFEFSDNLGQKSEILLF